MRSSDTALFTERLGKLYAPIGSGAGYQTFRQKLASPFSKRSSLPQTDEPWALRDLNFEVKRGEAWGILGPNGAGKSTLLKIFARILWPTEGAVEIRGKVSALLELGTGFHPELTGRENVYFNGTILGMSRKEIAKKFDEIVAFSGQERVIDRPVKQYSTGMQARLAFSVIAHFDPSEILVIDEALAAGDNAFRERCGEKMEEICRNGRTVLIVSHDNESILRFTKRCLYLKAGREIARGESKEILDLYLKS